MQITPLQCRLARLATGWTANDLAGAAGLATSTVLEFEKGRAAFKSSLSAIKAVFEYAGVVFLTENEPSQTGGEGIRFCRPEISLLQRLAAERYAIDCRIEKMKREGPIDDGTLKGIRSSAAAYSKTLKDLEKSIVALDARIQKIAELEQNPTG